MSDKDFQITNATREDLEKAAMLIKDASFASVDDMHKQYQTLVLAAANHAETKEIDSERFSAFVDKLEELLPLFNWPAAGTVYYYTVVAPGTYSRYVVRRGDTSMIFYGRVAIESRIYESNTRRDS